MIIIGVSAAGFAGLDPARAPQIRVPILMKAVLVPEWEWVRMDDPRTRWVQVFARLRPGQTIESAQAPLQGLFSQIRSARDDAAGRERLVAVHARTLHGGQAPSRKRRHRLLQPAQRLLHAAPRLDVHGGPRAAHRLRQRRQPVDRQSVHAAARDRRAAVARRARDVSSFGSC